MKKTTALILSALVLSGCASDTLAQQEQPQEEMSREEIRKVMDESTLSEDQKVRMAELAWEATWDETPASDKMDMCMLWFGDPELVIDFMGDPTFSEMGTYLSPGYITGFFERSC